MKTKIILENVIGGELSAIKGIEKSEFLRHCKLGSAGGQIGFLFEDFLSRLLLEQLNACLTIRTTKLSVQIFHW